MKHLSIKLRVTLWFAIALLLLASLAVAIIVPLSETVRQNTSHSRLVSLVEHSMRFIEVENGLLKIDSDFVPYIDGVYLLIYAEDRAVLAGSLPPGVTLHDTFEDAVLRQFNWGETGDAGGMGGVGGTQFYFYDRVVALPGFPRLWVRGFVPADAVSGEMLLTAALVVLPLLAVLAAVGGYVLTRRAFRPIEVLQRTVDEISSGDDLSRRIELDRGNDELHRLAETFNEMFARLETSFEEERRFAADVSHELRTPLSVIIAECEYALQLNDDAERADKVSAPTRNHSRYNRHRRGGPCVLPHTEALEVILRQAVKMQKMTESLLLLTRMEQGTEALPMERLNMSRLLEELCGDFELMTDGIAFESDIVPGVFVDGNKDLLTRMIMNLLGNAVRYSKPEGDRHIWVWLLREESEAGESMVVLKVKDDGIGISQQQLGSIWNRFYQADPSRENGMGLGLSIVQGVAKLHGGEVSVKSEEGAGSTFEVRLPLIEIS